ncbi:MAG: DUF4190 domain-containing protein [Promicromonosporaceae bacterium]|nr:DUF4190 domain-containing protein [Promicromonosporaceae bacterium]
MTDPYPPSPVGQPAPVPPPTPYAAPYPYLNPYGPPAGPPGPPVPPPGLTDGVSVAALVTGLVGLGPVALGLGIAGTVRTSRAYRRGKGMAIAGIIIGGLQVLAYTVAITVGITTASLGDTGGGSNGPAPESGSHYGDNSVLDRLWDKCAAGDMASCDDLYFLSDDGTDYENFGLTCGNRTDGNEYCVETESST